ALPHLRLPPRVAQPLADGRARAALPHHRAVDRPAGRALPHHRRLALIGDADRRDVAAGDARGREGLATDGDRRREDLIGVVLDMTRRRVVLRDLAIGRAAGTTLP